MSHSTELTIEIGLDKFEINCGSRTPAESCGVRAETKRTFTNDEAVQVLWSMPTNGAGRMALFGVLCDLAEYERLLYKDSNSSGTWLSVEVRHCV